MSNIRVLLIAPSLDIVGGQSVQAARLLEAIRGERGLAVEFQPTNPRLPGALRKLQQLKYVRTVATEAAYTGKLMALAKYFDIFHIFTAGFSSYWLTALPAILGSSAGPKLVLHYHDGRAQTHFERSPLAAKLAARVDHIVVPSQFLVDVLARFGLQASAIPNIADDTGFRYRRRATLRPRFLHNRGLESHYNVPCTIRAFAAIQKRYPEASLVVAHEGPLRQRLEAMASKMGLRHVIFAGAVTQERMRELYDEADIYLMSPDIDNMPLSVFECYASGLPLVSTAAGGVPWIVTHNQTGLLVPLNDDCAMAEAALRLLEEPGLGLRLAENGREECARYRSEALAVKWACLYRDVLSR